MSYYLTKDVRWNDLFSVIVGFVDIIAGLLVYLSRSFNFASNIVIIFLSLFYVCLGVWVLGINIIRKNYFEWKGIIDIISAVSLFLIFSGSVNGIFEVIGIIIIIKGILGLFVISIVEH